MTSPSDRPTGCRRASAWPAARRSRAAELEMWLEQLALDPWARALVWREEPQPERLQEFSVVVIGAGAGGLGAAVLPQAGRRARTS